MAPGADQKIDAPCVLLTGASSQIGVFAIPRLLQAGFRVLAVSRSGKPEWCPVLEQVEWLNETAAARASQSCDYLLSAGPMELADRFLESGPQFQSAVVFSSSSVETKLESASASERSQIQTMLALETSIRQNASNREMKLVILRPTLIYGCGLDTNISRLADWISRFGFIPVNGRAQGLRQPVHADDLASVAISALTSNEILPAVLALSGGETLGFSDMAGRIFAAQAKPERLLRLPQWLFVLLVSIARVLRFAGGINAEMVKRQAVDLVFDDRQARQMLNYKPRPFSPGEKDFCLPDFYKN